MVLSDVEETVTIVEVEEENVDPAVRVSSFFPWTALSPASSLLNSRLY
jgi:hypothetical protein